MIKDIFFSFKENLRQKTSNPFFGTLIVVWIIHNWKLIFTFFNFEQDQTLRTKIEFLSGYLDTIPFLLNLGQSILITIIVLVITYTLLNLSRLIVNFFEKRLTPWVYKITDSKSVVLKSTYQTLLEERDLLSQKLDLEREAKSKLQTEITRLEDRIKEILESRLTDSSSDANRSTENKTEELDILLENIKRRNYSEFFEWLIDNVNNREFVDTRQKEDKINFFLKSGIISLKEKDFRDLTKRQYVFTDKGERVMEKFVNDKLKNE